MKSKQSCARYILLFVILNRFDPLREVSYAFITANVYFACLKKALDSSKQNISVSYASTHSLSLNNSH